MEIKQVKNIVRQMVDNGVAEKEIDAFISATGYTLDDVKNFKDGVGVDEVIKTGRAAAEGASFGMGDIMAGYTNTILNDITNVTNGTSLKQRAGGLANYLKHTAFPMTIKDSEDFKYGRKEFVEGQEKFAKEHPVLSLAGELVGGLASGVGGAAKIGGAKFLAKLGKVGTGFATGALSGGLYGAGSGATADADKIDPLNAVKESGKGTFLGGVFGAGVPVAWNQAGKLAHHMNKQVRAYKQLSKAAKGKLEESIEKKVPLIDMADKRALRVISGADKADMDASEMLYDYANARMQKVKSNTEQVLDDIFGDKGYDSVLKQRHETAQKIAEPLYDKVFRVPKVKIDLDPMSKLVAEELRSNPYSAQALKGYPDNSFRFLDAVKRGLDYKIKAIQTGIEQGKLKPADGVVLGDLMKSRTALLDKLDKVNPNYKLARSVAEQGFKFEEGAKAGQRAFLDPADDIISKVSDMGRGGARPDFAAMRKKAALLKGQGVAEKRLAQIDLAEQIINSAAEAEKAGYKMGMGQALRKLLEGGSASWENTPQKLFNPNRVRKLQAAGIDLKKHLPKIEKEMKAADNMRGLFRGSQTAERQMDIGEIPTTLSGLATKGIKKLLSKAFVVSPKDIARMSIDPGYAAIMRAKAGMLPKSNYVDISGAGGAFSNIFGLLTRGEKAKVRDMVGRKLKASGISTRAINKSIGTSADSKKLQMLEFVPEFLEQEAIGSKTAQTPRYKYEFHPVKNEYGYDVANITKRDERFYNVNPYDFYESGAQKKRSSQGFPRSQSAFNGSSLKDGFPGLPHKQGGNQMKPFNRTMSGITPHQEGTNPLPKNSGNRLSRSPSRGPSGALTPRRLSQKPTGSLAKGTHSIPEEKPNVNGKKKQKFNMRDFLILLQRPYNVGLQGNIAAENYNQEK